MSLKAPIPHQRPGGSSLSTSGPAEVMLLSWRAPDLGEFVGCRVQPPPPQATELESAEVSPGASILTRSPHVSGLGISASEHPLGTCLPRERVQEAMPEVYVSSRKRRTGSYCPLSFTEGGTVSMVEKHRLWSHTHISLNTISIPYTSCLSFSVYS